MIDFTDHEIAELDAEFKQEVRNVRAHTARIRSALGDLPKTAAAQGWNISSDKEDLRAVLQEIIGSATEIADILGVEL